MGNTCLIRVNPCSSAARNRTTSISDILERFKRAAPETRTGRTYRSHRFRCGLPTMGLKDLASVRLAWRPTFSSIPGEARVLLSSPTNAKRHRNRIPVRDRETLLSAQGAASTDYTCRKVRAALRCARVLEEQPKKPLCCNLPTKAKSGFKIFSTGSRKHAVHQPTPYPRSACCKQRAGFKRSLHQFGSLKARGHPSFASAFLST